MSFGKFRDDNAAKAGDSLGVSHAADKVQAYLGKGSRISGTMVFAGPVELDAQVEGEITAQDRLVVGESGVIHARITGSDITIRGTVQGDIIASKRLVLKKPARVIGNIQTPVLSIEEGVLFEGKASMPAPKQSEPQKDAPIAASVSSGAKSENVR